MDAASAQDFDGGYLTFGFARGETDFNSTSTLFDPRFDTSVGPVAIYFGAGYDVVFDAFVIGAMADYETATTTENVTVTSGKDSYDLDSDWFATARVRGGYLVRDDTLVYASAGIARLATSYQTQAFLSPATQGSTIQNGAAFGLGLEHHLSQAASVRLEYIRADFGDSGPLGDVGFRPEIEPVYETVRLGVVIRF